VPGSNLLLEGILMTIDLHALRDIDRSTDLLRTGRISVIDRNLNRGEIKVGTKRSAEEHTLHLSVFIWRNN
jgi:hypothetical protein